MIKIIVQHLLLIIAGIFLSAWGAPHPEWWSFPVFATGLIILAIGLFGGAFRLAQLEKMQAQTNRALTGSLTFDVDNDKKVYCTNSDYVNIILDRLQRSNTNAERYRAAIQTIVDAVPQADPDVLTQAIRAGRDLLGILIVLLFGTMGWSQVADCYYTDKSKEWFEAGTMCHSNPAERIAVPKVNDSEPVDWNFICSDGSKCSKDVEPGRCICEPTSATVKILHCPFDEVIVGNSCVPPAQKKEGCVPDADGKGQTCSGTAVTAGVLPYKMQPPDKPCDKFQFESVTVPTEQGFAGRVYCVDIPHPVSEKEWHELQEENYLLFKSENLHRRELDAQQREINILIQQVKATSIWTGTQINGSYATDKKCPSHAWVNGKCLPYCDEHSAGSCAGRPKVKP